MDADGCAQVDPKELCEKLMAQAVEQGAKLVMGTVKGVQKSTTSTKTPTETKSKSKTMDEDNEQVLEQVEGVLVDYEDGLSPDGGGSSSSPDDGGGGGGGGGLSLVPCDAVVVAMGPWSSMAQDWLGLPVPITGIKSTSVVFKSEVMVRVSDDDKGV